MTQTFYVSIDVCWEGNELSSRFSEVSFCEHGGGEGGDLFSSPIFPPPQAGGNEVTEQAGCTVGPLACSLGAEPKATGAAVGF